MLRVYKSAAALALVALAAAVLHPGLAAWFVADDFHHLGWVNYIHNPWTAFAYPQFGTLLYRPVTYVTEFYLHWALGMSPVRIHTVDLILHAASAVVLFHLLLVLFEPFAKEDEKGHSRILPAFAGAAVFAAHPVSALTACWFACRADTLGVLFCLLTLLVTAKWPRPKALTLIAAFLLSFLAMAAKDTYLILFLPAFIVALLTNREAGAGRRLGQAALPVFAAFALCLGLRLLVIGKFGGYAEPPWGAGLMDLASYHLPRVIGRAGRDFALPHLPPGDFIIPPLLGAWVAAAVLGLFAALWRAKALAVGGLLIAAAALLPVWNLSHMLFFREDRLLYLPLVGFVISLSSFAAAPRSRALRNLSSAVILFAAAMLAYLSLNGVTDWRRTARENRRIQKAIAAHLAKLPPATAGRRIYVLGLPGDSYYLDAMVRLALPEPLKAIEVMPGDQASFLWRPSDLTLPPPPSIPAEALPKRKKQLSDPAITLETVNPPDLAAAAKFDSEAKVLKWDGARIKDITLELRNLHARRESMQRMIADSPTRLPSFSFLESPLKFDWEVSPECEIISNGLGMPYLFIAQGPDPWLVSPPLSFNPLFAGRFVFSMTLAADRFVPPGAEGCLSWQNQGETDFTPQRKICFEVFPDGNPHDYTIDLNASSAWISSDKISRVRLDPVSFPARFHLHWAEFLPAKTD